MKNKITVYTDGGCSRNGVGGWSYVVVNETKNTHYVKSGGALQTTNNAMELTALLTALKDLIAHDIVKDVTVISDSEYAKNTYTTWMHSWATKGWTKSDGNPVNNLELVKQLYGLYPKIQLDDYIWVKGHSGNVYNELCDRYCTNEIKKLKGEPTIDADAILTENPTYVKLNSMTKQEIIKYVIERGFTVVP